MQPVVPQAGWTRVGRRRTVKRKQLHTDTTDAQTTCWEWDFKLGRINVHRVHGG